MKNTFIRVAVASIFIVALAGTALAAWDDGPGRGRGGMVPEKESPSMLSLYSRSTPNMPSPAFATSMETSGRTNKGRITKEERTARFTSPTVESFSQDIAQGHGEHLVWLATLLGVSSELQPQFFSLTQAHYRKLIQAGYTASQAMVTALERATTILPNASKNPLMLLGKAAL